MNSHELLPVLAVAAERSDRAEPNVEHRTAGINKDSIASLPLRAIIAISSHVSCYGLQSMLKRSPAVCDVATVTSEAQAAELLALNRFDLLITSVDMDPAGYPGLREKARSHGARVLLMMRGQERDDVIRAAMFDADGYLIEKQLTPQVLDEAVRRLAHGETVLPNSFLQGLLAISHGRRQPAAAQVITRREQHTLRLLADGLSNKQIASRLGISEHGAKRHVANLLAKLNCANRAHAVALAFREGLVDQ